MSDKLTWYVSRSSGLVAWGLLAAAIIFGLLLASRVLNPRRATAWTLSVHRFLSALAVLFTGIHLVALHLDDFVEFGVLDFFIPFRDTWRPGAVAWGVVGWWLLLAIQGSSLAMKYLPRRVWKGIHLLSPLLFITATVHGFEAGSDTGRIYMAVVTGVVVFLTVLTMVRVVLRRRTAPAAKNGPDRPTHPGPAVPTISPDTAPEPAPQTPRVLVDAAVGGSRGSSSLAQHAQRQPAPLANEASEAP